MDGCNLVAYLPTRDVVHCCCCASLLSFALLVHLLLFSDNLNDLSFVHTVGGNMPTIGDLVAFGHTLLSNLNNDLGDIEMEQEFADGKK